MTAAPSSTKFLVYEQPLVERVRMFLRLELLLEQIVHHAAQPSVFDSRAAVSGLLEISALLARGDIRSELVKELERYTLNLSRLADNPDVDNGMLEKVLGELEKHRAALISGDKPLGQSLATSEFLRAVKNRISIPGGTCQFDLPSYYTWLRQPHPRRARDFAGWYAELEPLRQGLAALLRLVRQSAASQSEVAQRGLFQKTLTAATPCPLIRVMLPATGSVFPEISGGKHRVSVRFFELDIEERPKQVQQDIHFKMSYCYF